MARRQKGSDLVTGNSEIVEISWALQRMIHIFSSEWAEYKKMHLLHLDMAMWAYMALFPA